MMMVVMEQPPPFPIQKKTPQRKFLPFPPAPAFFFFATKGLKALQLPPQHQPFLIATIPKKASKILGDYTVVFPQQLPKQE